MMGVPFFLSLSLSLSFSPKEGRDNDAGRHVGGGGKDGGRSFCLMSGCHTAEKKGGKD